MRLHSNLSPVGSIRDIEAQELNLRAPVCGNGHILSSNNSIINNQRNLARHRRRLPASDGGGQPARFRIKNLRCYGDAFHRPVLFLSLRDRMQDALIGTGFPFRNMQGLEEYIDMFRVMTQKCAGLRRPGAATLTPANGGTSRPKPAAHGQTPRAVRRRDTAPLQPRLHMHSPPTRAKEPGLLARRAARGLRRCARRR